MYRSTFITASRNQPAGIRSKSQRDVAIRIAGAAVLGGACGLMFLGGIAPRNAASPDLPAFAAGFVSLALACLGTLYLIQGVTLRDGWKGQLEQSDRTPNDGDEVPWVIETDSPSAWGFEGRMAIATHLILRHRAAHSRK